MAKEKILAIDDEPDVLRVLKYRLEKAGYEVLTALDGIKGLELARKEKPNLIILDIMMPGEDGYSVCKRLKNMSESAGIPVIFLSAKAEEKDIIRGFQSGGIYYITKPYEPEVLLETVKKALENPLELEREKEKWIKRLIIFSEDELLKRAIQENFSDLIEAIFLNKEEDFSKISNLDVFDIIVLDLSSKNLNFEKIIQENLARFKKDSRFILIAESYSPKLDELRAIIPYPCTYLYRPFGIDEFLFNLRY